MTMHDDLDVYFDERLGAQEVTVAPDSVPVDPFKAYFNEPYASHELGDSFSLKSAGYYLVCKASDVTDLVDKKSMVTVTAGEFLVEAVMPDGTGLARVALSSPREVVRMEI